VKINNFILFLVPSLIWGSTWLVITFQLGKVPPILSVGYRFFLAGIILFIFCLLYKLKLRFSRRQHLFFALQGVLLFGFNYWLVYLAEQLIPSGLVAVVFSVLIFLNIIFNSILLKNEIKGKVVFGAILGLIGTGIIFAPELEALNFTDKSFLGLTFCVAGVLFSSLGNITSAYNQRHKLPVVQTNAFGMLYGSLIMLAIAMAQGNSFVFDTSWTYLSSLAYLVLFGSIVGFSFYLKLIGNIGPDRAAYSILIIPVIALILSTIFEGYIPSAYTWSGVGLILAGNVMALRK